GALPLRISRDREPTFGLVGIGEVPVNYSDRSWNSSRFHGALILRSSRSPSVILVRWRPFGPGAVFRPRHVCGSWALWPNQARSRPGRTRGMNAAKQGLPAVDRWGERRDSVGARHGLRRLPIGPVLLVLVAV